MKWLADDWEKAVKGAVCSGIVGDKSHRANGGYHVSRADNPRGNYSTTRPDDRTGSSTAASAVDMSMPKASMKLVTGRFVKVFKDKTDPRRVFVNAVNGWMGTGEAQRYDFYANKQSWATADHTWHVHLSIRRKYTADMNAMRAISSIIRGQSKEAYVKAKGGVPPAYPGRLLKRDDNQAKADPAVKQFQSRLHELGWTAFGPADGYFGEKTEFAVRRFQESRGLPADGVVGPETWDALW